MRQRTPFGIGRTGRHKLDVGETAAGQYALRGMIQIVQPGAGASWWPKVVVPQSSRAGAPPTIEAVGGRRVMLHPELTTICVPREMLPLPDCRQISEPPVSLGLSLNEQEFLETAPAEALAQALKQLVATILPHYFRSIKTTAEIAGLHPRALQPRLRAQSISFRQLVDEVRAEQATVLLRDSDASVTDIAFDLGYTDLAHFTRAFRRWNGVSPRQFRNQCMNA